MPKTKAALVGFGCRLRGVTQYLSKATSDVEYVGVYDPSPESVQAAMDTLCSGGRVYQSVAEIAADPAVDWVMIGSPNCDHASQAVAAMRGGKNVFCEKPLATSMADAISIQQARQETGRTLVLGLTLRYSPFYRTMKERIEGGCLGKIISMEFNETLGFNHGGHVHSHPWRRFTAKGGSHILEKCCHDIDLAIWMLESLPKRVASFGGKDFFLPKNAHIKDELGTAEDGREAFVCWPSLEERVNPFTGGSDVVDNQVCIIEFANGVRATFHTNCVAAIMERRMYLLGTKGGMRGDVIEGSLEYSPLGFDVEVERIIDRDVGGGHAGGDEILGQDLAACMTMGAEPPASVYEGLTSAVTCFALNEAMRTGTVVDCVPLWQQLGVDV